MLTLLPVSHWLSIHGLMVAMGLLIYVLTTHSLQQRRAPTAAISWVLTIALLPYVGLPLYLLFGTRKLVRAKTRIVANSSRPDSGSIQDWPRQLAASMNQPPVASYQKLHIHAGGKQALQALWDTIDSAKSDLVVCTFILAGDTVGRQLITRLIEKARSGVRIRLQIDGVGYLMGGWVNLNKLKGANVRVALHGPILHLPFKSSTNMRNHRKMVVADGKRLWCGGRNFAAEYFEGVPKHKAWEDLTFDLEGALAAQSRALFDQDWATSTGTPTPEAMNPEPSASAAFAQVIASGPDQADDTVHDILVTACFKASNRIIAVTPYFVPGDALLMALSLAARRGVMVDLVLPKCSNHHMADFARHRALRHLAASGGRVWLVPYMLHAKAVVIDDCLALAGSANLDSRSLFLNYELMVAFYACADVQLFADFVEQHRKLADRYHGKKPELWRDLAEGIVLWLAFQL